MSAADRAAKGYPRERTAPLLLDPHRDFPSEGGKLWPRVAEVARDVGLRDDLRAITAALRRQGLPANTCTESTARFGVELGYRATLVRDANAALRPEAMRAAHDVGAPSFAHAVPSTAELVAAL